MSGGRLYPSLEHYSTLAADAPPTARIPLWRRLTVSDPFDAYRAARRGTDGVFLETTGGQSGWGYFCVDPVERLTARAPAVPRSAGSSPSLAALTGILENESLVRDACPVPYPCGLFGWFSYDLARELEAIPETSTDDRDVPQLQVGLFDRVVAWREPRTSPSTPVYVVACPRVSDDPTESYLRGRNRIDELREAMRTDVPARAVPTNAASATFVSECGRSSYAERVKRIKRYIREGDTFQVNISHRLAAPATVSSVAVYDALRQVNPAPYSGILEFPGIELVSASPELLLSIEGDSLSTEPIAGTRPRGATPQEDAALEAELLSDEKERAEHAMLVDLERNDVGKVATYGSVTVREYRRVDRYSEVMHLVSRVDGRLRPDVSLAGVARADPLTPADSTPADRLCAAIAAVFPGGTITGAPKPRTMEIIEELETTRRGPYTGSMGMIGFDARATLNIIIRTIVRTGDEFHLRVGAGIVHDSVPDREYDETMDKARALITALDEALGAAADWELAT